MRKFIAVFAALVAVIGLGLTVAPAAQASSSVSNADGKLTGQRAAAADPGYYGTLTAYPTACVVLERKSNSGVWVRDGFENAGVIWGTFRICWDFANGNPGSWRVHTNDYPVNGLRFVSNQGLTKTLCSSAADCLSSLA